MCLDAIVMKLSVALVLASLSWWVASYNFKVLMVLVMALEEE